MYWQEKENEEMNTSNFACAVADLGLYQEFDNLTAGEISLVFLSYRLS